MHYTAFFAKILSYAIFSKKYVIYGDLCFLSELIGNENMYEVLMENMEPFYCIFLVSYIFI